MLLKRGIGQAAGGRGQGVGKNQALSLLHASCTLKLVFKLVYPYPVDFHGAGT